VVDAVRCADEIQRSVAEQKYRCAAEQAESSSASAIHVGDIIIEENDIFGDGGQYRSAARRGSRSRVGFAFPTMLTVKLRGKV